MKNVFVALSLALALIPVSALADDQASPGAPALSPAQRQQMFQTFRAFHQREEQLHQQFRAQLLGTLTAAHRAAVANAIGQLAVASNPDPQRAAAQLDSLLSQSEKEQILSAHNTFRTQAKALHDQMKSQMHDEMPAGPPPMGHPDGGEMHGSQMQPDAGQILLHVLSHVGGDDHHMMGAGHRRR
jgi:hypothetical protein